MFRQYTIGYQLYLLTNGMFSGFIVFLIKSHTLTYYN